jgi:hypothetical protein
MKSDSEISDLSSSTSMDLDPPSSPSSSSLNLPVSSSPPHSTSINASHPGNVRRSSSSSSTKSRLRKLRPSKALDGAVGNNSSTVNPTKSKSKSSRGFLSKKDSNQITPNPSKGIPSQPVDHITLPSLSLISSTSPQPSSSSSSPLIRHLPHLASPSISHSTSPLSPHSVPLPASALSTPHSELPSPFLGLTNFNLLRTDSPSDNTREKDEIDCGNASGSASTLGVSTPKGVEGYPFWGKSVGEKVARESLPRGKENDHEKEEERDQGMMEIENTFGFVNKPLKSSSTLTGSKNFHFINQDFNSSMPAKSHPNSDSSSPVSSIRATSNSSTPASSIHRASIDSSSIASDNSTSTSIGSDHQKSSSPKHSSPPKSSVPLFPLRLPNSTSSLPTPLISNLPSPYSKPQPVTNTNNNTGSTASLPMTSPPPAPSFSQKKGKNKFALSLAGHGVFANEGKGGGGGVVGGEEAMGIGLGGGGAMVGSNGAETKKGKGFWDTVKGEEEVSPSHFVLFFLSISDFDRSDAHVRFLITSSLASRASIRFTCYARTPTAVLEDVVVTLTDGKDGDVGEGVLRVGES